MATKKKPKPNSPIAAMPVPLETAEQIKFPCALQPKYDGVRCLAAISNDEVSLRDKLGNPIEGLRHIEQTLKTFSCFKGLTLDGILCKPGLTQAEVLEILRDNSQNKTEQTEQLAYYLFDIPSADIPYHRRQDLLQTLVYTSAVKQMLSIDVHCVEALFEVCLAMQADGYKGAFVKNYDSKPVLGPCQDFISVSVQQLTAVVESVAHTPPAPTARCRYEDKVFYAAIAQRDLNRCISYFGGENKEVSVTASVRHLGFNSDGLPVLPEVVEIFLKIN